MDTAIRNADNETASGSPTALSTSVSPHTPETACNPHARRTLGSLRAVPAAATCTRTSPATWQERRPGYGCRRTDIRDDPRGGIRRRRVDVHPANSSTTCTAPSRAVFQEEEFAPPMRRLTDLPPVGEQSHEKVRYPALPGAGVLIVGGGP